MELGSAAPSDAAVARILDAEGRPVGAGFLTGRREVLTCAHVVAKALGSAHDAAERPAGRLRIDFPLAQPGRTVQAHIGSWTPVRSDGSGDVAVLRLVTDSPAKATVARLVENVAGPDRRVRTFGFPDGYDDGTWSVGWLRGRQGTGWLQYDTDPASQHRVERGFSGAPVWDVAEGGVVGMVVAADDRPDVRTAYLIPTETLRESWSSLGDSALPACPFRSLEPFQERDAPLFHGRAEPARRMADLLGHAPATTLVGPSGCGKSSLLYAGLLPRLRSRADLEIVVFRPGQLGRTPLAALALALLPRLEPDLTETARLAELPRLTGLLRDGQMPAIVDRLLARQGKDRLLVVADQFEEALIGTEQADRDALAAALGHCLRPGSRLQVVLGLRADFLTLALQHPGLAPLLGGDRLFTVGAMSDEELRAAVVRPLDRTGVVYEPGLVDRILADLGTDPGRLPLLEFTLTKLWERQRAGVIGHAAYEALGQVNDALVNHAEQVWTGGLTQEEHREARALLVQLVHPGGDRIAPTRRTVARSELPPRQWRIAQRLMTTRLVVPGEEYRRGDGPPEETVELAHETLLTQWGRLREFVEADHDFRVWQEDLRRRIAQWAADGHARRRLLRGADLRDARGWQSRRQGELRPAEDAFIHASVRGRRRRQVTLTALVVSVALVVGLGSWAWRSDLDRRSASLASRVLVQQARDAQDGTTLSERGTQLGGPYTALLLALRAYRTQDTAQTRALLADMYARYGFADLLAPHYLPATALLDSPIGGPQTSSVADARGRVIAGHTARDEVVVWHAGGSRIIRRPTGHDADTTAVSPNGAYVALTASPDLRSGPPDPQGQPVVLYDVRSGKPRELQRPKGGDPLPQGDDFPSVPGLNLPPMPSLPGITMPTMYARLAFDPEGELLLGQTGLFGGSGRLVLWDTASGRIKKVLPGLKERVSQLWLGPGGDSLITLNEPLDLTGATAHSVDVWDLTGKSPTRRKVISWKTETQHPAQVDVSPDLTRVARIETRPRGLRLTASVSVYELPSGKLLRREKVNPQEAPSGIAVAAEGTKVLTYSVSGDTPSGVRRPGDGPVTRIGGRWQTVDLIGESGHPSVLLTDLGVLALVGPGHGDPLRRLPRPVDASRTPPPAGDARRWMAHFCHVLGDERLPDEAEEKLPPGAYRGPVCPGEKGIRG